MRHEATAMQYTKGVSEPWFSLIKLGIKTVEGRLNTGDHAKMQPGDTVTFTNDQLGFSRSTTKTVAKKTAYETFDDYPRAEQLGRCLPGVEQGVQVYRQYYAAADEQAHGVVALHLR